MIRKALIINSILFLIAFQVSLFNLQGNYVLNAVIPNPGLNCFFITDTTKNKSASADEYWPSLRGEGSRGTARITGYPVNWDGESGRNISWKTETPGIGKSSPVVWGKRLFITADVDDKCILLCYDTNTGRLLWKTAASGIAGEPAVKPKTDPDAGLAVSTAATDGKSVCAIFSNGNLICCDFEGKVRWSKNIGIPVSSYGYASSLLIYDGVLIVQYDSNKKISVMGFVLDDGKLKWETIRKGSAAWSSPVIGRFNNTDHVIINGNPFVSAFDPHTGNPLWEYQCMSGDVVPSVAVNSTFVYAVTDYAKLVAIRPGKEPKTAWEDNSYTPDVSSPVANDRFLFVSTGIGDVACYNAFTGDTLWTHYLNEPFYASPVIAGNNVYLLDRKGTMHIISVAEKFRLVSEPKLGEPADCTPAFSEKRIFLRAGAHIYCISEKSE